MERPCSRNHLHVVGGYGRECGKLRVWDCSTKGIAVLEGQWVNVVVVVNGAATMLERR